MPWWQFLNVDLHLFNWYEIAVMTCTTKCHWSAVILLISKVDDNTAFQWWRWILNVWRYDWRRLPKIYVAFFKFTTTTRIGTIKMCRWSRRFLMVSKTTQIWLKKWQFLNVDLHLSPRSGACKRCKRSSNCLAMQKHQAVNNFIVMMERLCLANASIDLGQQSGFLKLCYGDLI